MAAQQATASSAMMSALWSPMRRPIWALSGSDNYGLCFAHVGFTAATPLPNQGFPARFLVAVLSDGGLRRSEAAALTWGDVQRWDDGSGRITVVRSKTDALAQGAVVAITPAAMRALDAIRPAGVASSKKVFGLSESQIARRVKAIARAAGLADWEFFSGHSGRVGMARRMAQNGARPHPRDRAPGPLETGRRHGRSLHPR